MIAGLQKTGSRHCSGKENKQPPPWVYPGPYKYYEYNNSDNQADPAKLPPPCGFFPPYVTYTGGVLILFILRHNMIVYVVWNAQILYHRMIRREKARFTCRF